MNLSLSAPIAAAQTARRAIVALESTVIAHGLPSPHNLETARACEQAVLQGEAIPATIAILDGRIIVGLTEEQVEQVAARGDVAKVNLSNFASVLAQGGWGATTVAATLHIAHAAGIKVFATGGIGGVHQGAGESFDVSADLNALARYPVITVCAGAKAILDLPKTLEALETLGVPVVGYGTDELPAFYSRSSGLRLDLRADTPGEVARLAQTHWDLGFRTGVLVVAPAPPEDEIPSDEISGVIREALEEATRRNLSGKAVTPFLLSRIAEKSSGRSLSANISLLKNNAAIAGAIARDLSRLETS
jgi:pseudouridine-5'-phosphate glycosidase